MMRSSLTRNVFRAILANEPYCASGYSKGHSWWQKETLRQRALVSPRGRYLSGSCVRLDAKKVLWQLDHEVRVGNLDQARSTYNHLLSEDPITDKSDGPVLNRFLTAVCNSSDPGSELVMRVLDFMLERNISLDAEAMGGLCRALLLQDNLEEALDLLPPRIHAYSPAERALISQAFKDFIEDEKSVSAQRAFDAYELLRVAFPETCVTDRLPIMHSLFNRERPDLACLVFGHMRQREESSARPNPEAYGQCFEGIAKCQDIDGLQVVYNMLKLDLHVEPTSRTRNGLMAAYTACGQPYAAIIDHFWKILDSWEGPTMGSFALALRACETWIPQGANEARKIIALMQDWQLEITKDIYDCYIGAIAGQCEFENTIELIDEMEDSIGVAPDAFTLGTFYNAIPWQYRKDEVEAWAKQSLPHLWQDLLAKYKEDIDEEWEIRYFKIDRCIRTGEGDELLYNVGEYSAPVSEMATRSAPLLLEQERA